MDSVPDIVDAVIILLALLSAVIWSVVTGKYISFQSNAKYERDFLSLLSKTQGLLNSS